MCGVAGLSPVTGLSISFLNSMIGIPKKLLFFNVYGISATLVEWPRTKCLSCLEKLCLKFRKSMCCALSEIMKYVYMGQGMAGWRAILWKNMLELLWNVKSEGTDGNCKLKQEYIYLIILIFSLFPAAARTLSITFWPASLASLAVWLWVSAIARQPWAQGTKTYRRAMGTLRCIRGSSSSPCFLSSFVPTLENPNAISTPVVSRKGGIKQVEEWGRRQPIKPTCCKNTPDAARAASPSALHPPAKVLWGSTNESLILRHWE